MTDIPQNITGKDLLQAIERIDKEGVPANAHSSTYYSELEITGF